MSYISIEKDVAAEKVSYKEWNEIIDYVKSPESGLKRLKNFQAGRTPIKYLHDGYQIKHYANGRSSFINIFSAEQGFKSFAAGIDGNDSMTGHEAYSRFEECYKMLNGMSRSLFSDFSGYKYKNFYLRIKNCVPIQIHYSLNNRTIYDKGYKADVSSCFPYELAQDLPTLHDCIEVKGIVEPNEEYPFAFYPISHHHAVYNEYRTWDWRLEKFYGNYYGKKFRDLAFTDSMETTILCKKSRYSLKDVVELLYSRRNEDAENKTVMNATIGYFHRENAPTLSHIAAVVIGRSIYHMILRAKILEFEGNEVHLINTDSILWRGAKCESIVVPPSEKELGAFVSESEDCQFCIANMNCYQILEKDGTLTTKYSTKTEDQKALMPFGYIIDNYEELPIFRRVGDKYEITSSN